MSAKIKTGMLVLSTAGHDKGLFYVVVREELLQKQASTGNHNHNCESENGETVRLFIADGRRRLVKSPKAKSPKHLQATDIYLEEAEYQTNRSIRRSIREYITKSRID